MHERGCDSFVGEEIKHKVLQRDQEWKGHRFNERMPLALPRNVKYATKDKVPLL